LSMGLWVICGYCEAMPARSRGMGGGGFDDEMTTTSERCGSTRLVSRSTFPTSSLVIEVVMVVWNRWWRAWGTVGHGFGVAGMLCAGGGSRRAQWCRWRPIKRRKTTSEHLAELVVSLASPGPPGAGIGVGDGVEVLGCHAQVEGWRMVTTGRNFERQVSAVAQLVMSAASSACHEVGGSGAGAGAGTVVLAQCPGARLLCTCACETKLSRKRGSRMPNQKKKTYLALEGPDLKRGCCVEAQNNTATNHHHGLRINAYNVFLDTAAFQRVQELLLKLEPHPDALELRSLLKLPPLNSEKSLSVKRSINVADEGASTKRLRFDYFQVDIPPFNPKNDTIGLKAFSTQSTSISLVSSNDASAPSHAVESSSDKPTILVEDIIENVSRYQRTEKNHNNHNEKSQSQSQSNGNINHVRNNSKTKSKTNTIQVSKV
ncbi:hypothetical protein BD410DRAFT_809845, partial [Rickenella mellea]